MVLPYNENTVGCAGRMSLAGHILLMLLYFRKSKHQIFKKNLKSNKSLKYFRQPKFEMRPIVLEPRL